jgi:site-specific recombinase XerC
MTPALLTEDSMGLFKPVIVTYRLKDGSYRTRDGARVTRKTRGARKHTTQSAKWYGRFTDGTGRKLRVPLSESKDIARRMLAKLSGDSQLASVGLADPFAEHLAKPLLDHLEDFRHDLTARARTSVHVNKTCNRIRAVCEGCGFLNLDQIDSIRVAEFLAGLQQQGPALPALDTGIDDFRKCEVIERLGIHPDSLGRILRRLGLSGHGEGKARRFDRATVEALEKRIGRGLGVATSNHYLVAFKIFTRWLVKQRRIAADPLSHLQRQNPDTDVRRKRRALKQDRFAAFITATAKGKTFRGLTGRDRLVLYTVAAHTGLRASELASLTPASFALTDHQPVVIVEAAYSKRRRKDVQPLRRDVAAMLANYLKGKPARKAVWPGTWKEAAAEMIRLDLAAAGISYEDDDERCFDFHAMRGQFISMLASQGVHPKVAQQLARHSDIRLTMQRYTHLELLDVAGALDNLPRIPYSAMPKQSGKIGQKFGRWRQGAKDESVQ